jgi:hypothetical protein
MRSLRMGKQEPLFLETWLCPYVQVFPPAGKPLPGAHPAPWLGHALGLRRRRRDLGVRAVAERKRREDTADQVVRLRRSGAAGLPQFVPTGVGAAFGG